MWRIKGVKCTDEEVEEGWEPFAVTTYPPACWGEGGHGGGVILWLRRWTSPSPAPSVEDDIRLYEMDKDGVFQLRYLVRKA